MRFRVLHSGCSGLQASQKGIRGMPKTDAGRQTVHLDFTYVIEGEATDDLRWRVLFRPPNQFTIVSRPVKPIADILPK